MCSPRSGGGSLYSTGVSENRIGLATVGQGVIFVICVLTFRRGVIGELGRLIGKPL